MATTKKTTKTTSKKPLTARQAARRVPPPPARPRPRKKAKKAPVQEAPVKKAPVQEAPAKKAAVRKPHREVDYDSFGGLLRQSRENAGMSLQAAGDAMEIRRQIVLGWEQEKTMPSPEQLGKVALVYKLNAANLLASWVEALAARKGVGCVVSKATLLA